MNVHWNKATLQKNQFKRVAELYIKNDQSLLAAKVNYLEQQYIMKRAADKPVRIPALKRIVEELMRANSLMDIAKRNQNKYKQVLEIADQIVTHGKLDRPVIVIAPTSLHFISGEMEAQVCYLFDIDPEMYFLQF